MGTEGWSPRDLEDLVVACPSCGAYSTGVAFGKRDWLQSPDPMIRDELAMRISSASGAPRIAPSTRFDIDEDTATAEPAWAVDASRVDQPLEPLTCQACDLNLPVTWRDIAGTHARLSQKDQRWLHGYVTMKETIQFGLTRRNVGLRGDLGTFINVSTPERTVGDEVLAARAFPLFVPSQKLIDLVDKRLLGRKPFFENLGRRGGPRCTRGRVGADDLPFPTDYAGPELLLDAELGIGMAEIARSLRQHGSTPLRGLGTLRIVDFEWGTDRGRLLYLEFDVRVRDAVAAACS